LIQYKKEDWINAFCQVNRAQTKYGIAPHKPIFLLSLLDAFDLGLIIDKKIFLTPELLAIFIDNWSLYVESENISDITLPFFYLQNDRLDGKQWWFVKTNQGYDYKKPIKSFNRLREVVAFAFFDDKLFLELSNKKFREELRFKLVSFFFPNRNKEHKPEPNQKSNYMKRLEQEILNENFGQASKKVQVQKEQEKYLRGELFKKVIPEIYDYSCAFSGLKVTTKRGFNLVESCHISPFSQTQDDHVHNGISLSPNMHKIFDRGLITVDEDYRLVISKQIMEDANHPYSLKKLEGKKITLPKNVNYFPSQEKFKYHRDYIFKY